jgi:hypothetical protein
MDNNKQLITKSVRTRDVDKGNNKFDQPYYWCFIFQDRVLLCKRRQRCIFIQMCLCVTSDGTKLVCTSPGRNVDTENIFLLLYLFVQGVVAFTITPSGVCRLSSLK